VNSLLPVSARLAWWSTAWLRGRVVADLALDEVLAGDATHRVVGVPGLDPSVALATAWGHLRSAGVDGLGLAWPIEGDPVGLAGPRELTEAAIDAGEAVVTTGHAWVPRREGAVVVWQWFGAAPRQVGSQMVDVGEADRRLRRALTQAAAELAELDVARWRPELADELMELRRPPRLRAAPGTPARCVELAARAIQAARIVDLATEDDGGAVSAREAELRRTALRELGTAARHALVAACSPEAWPPD